MGNKNILVKIPTRGRGWEWLRPWLNLSEAPNITFLISADSDDSSISNIPDWLKNETRLVKIIVATSQNKIHAINRDIEEHGGPWDVLIVGSDDMVPTLRGYDNFIAENCPDDGAMWLPTENSSIHKRGGHNMIPGSAAYLQHWICMLPIMGRAYYEIFGYVYHPEYEGFFCDNEWTDVARQRNKLTFVNRPDIIYHNHPDWTPTGRRDNTYSRYNLPIFKRDQRTYIDRKRNGFPV